MSEKRSPHMGIGVISLAVIFVVLCMTVLALLSWQTARNERALAQRAGETVQAYYAADAQACHIRRALEKEPLYEVDGVEITWQGYEAAFQCPINDALTLDVTLHVENGSSTVLAWNTAAASHWQPDGRIEVWDGT